MNLSAFFLCSNGFCVARVRPAKGLMHVLGN